MKAFLAKWATLANGIAELILISGFFAMAGALLNRGWRQQPFIPLAGLLLGPIAGRVGAIWWGEAGAIGLTFAGTIIGPAIVMKLQDEAFARRVIEGGLEKFFPKKPGS